MFHAAAPAALSRPSGRRKQGLHFAGKTMHYFFKFAVAGVGSDDFQNSLKTLLTHTPSSFLVKDGATEMRHKSLLEFRFSNSSRVFFRSSALIQTDSTAL
jgi:hypothetical protein